MKLTEEQREDLLELQQHPGFLVLLSELEELKEAIVTSVIKYDLGEGDERELIRRKCRAEGAAQLLASLKTRLNHLKPRDRKS